LCGDGKILLPIFQLGLARARSDSANEHQ